MNLKKFDRYIDVKVVAVVLVVCAVVAAFAIANNIAERPDNVLWSMVDNNLSASGVSCHNTQTTQNVHRDEQIQLLFGKQNLLKTTTKLTSATADVSTESIASANTSYVRYTAISTKTKSASGQVLNFTPILNLWGKEADATGANLSQAARQACGLPFANLPGNKRGAIITALKTQSGFNYDPKTLKTVKANGHKAYQYQLVIQPVPYVTFMQSVAKALGLHDLDSIKPSSYKNTAQGHLVVTIEAHNQKLVSVSYPGTDHTVTVTAYGAGQAITPPNKTIAASELESRLQQIH